MKYIRRGEEGVRASDLGPSENQAILPKAVHRWIRIRWSFKLTHTPSEDHKSMQGFQYRKQQESTTANVDGKQLKTLKLWKTWPVMAGNKGKLWPYINTARNNWVQPSLWQKWAPFGGKQREDDWTVTDVSTFWRGKAGSTLPQREITGHCRHCDEREHVLAGNSTKPRLYIAAGNNSGSCDCISWQEMVGNDWNCEGRGQYSGNQWEAMTVTTGSRGGLSTSWRETTEKLWLYIFMAGANGTVWLYASKVVKDTLRYGGKIQRMWLFFTAGNNWKLSRSRHVMTGKHGYISPHQHL